MPRTKLFGKCLLIASVMFMVRALSAYSFFCLSFGLVWVVLPSFSGTLLC